MRLKNIMLVLLVGLLVFLLPGTVEAASMNGGGSSFAYDYNCGYCNGDYMNYYSAVINSPYVWCAVSHRIDNNTLINCNKLSYGLSASDDKFYTVKIIREDGLYYGYVRLSTDDTFEIYKTDGTVTTKPLSEFTSSNFGGISNGLYFGYWIYSASYNPYHIDYEKSCNYQYEATSFTDSNNKMKKLVKFLTGELTELPDYITEVAPLPAYDLEAPLGVTVTSSEHSRNFQIYGDGLYQGSDLVIPYKVWWNQSNIDLSGYETEFYVREYGKYKKSLFSSWVDVMTPFVFDKSFVTAKYCNNSLKYYEFSPKDKKRIYSYCQKEIGEEPYAVEFYHPDFMLRNKKEDENGQMHYSNWVYVKTYDDGTYSVFEMKQEYDLEEDPDETGNIDVDSPNYDDEIIYEDTDYSPDIGGVKDSAKFITVLKDLANSLGDFPDLFAQIFSFLPSWVLVCIGTLFVVIMLKGIF